jgi:hypothetical protein
MPCLRMQVVTATATLRLMGDTALLAPAPDGPGLDDEPQALSATTQQTAEKGRRRLRIAECLTESSLWRLRLLPGELGVR